MGCVEIRINQITQLCKFFRVKNMITFCIVGVINALSFPAKALRIYPHEKEYKILI